MKRIKHTKRSRDTRLQVECDGVTVNITIGLHDTEGRPVTSVEVIPVSEGWILPDMDEGRRLGFNLRVRKEGSPGPAGWIRRDGGFYSVTGDGPFTPAEVVEMTEPDLRAETIRWVEETHALPCGLV